jgi:hypothetical protein
MEYALRVFNGDTNKVVSYFQKQEELHIVKYVGIINDDWHCIYPKDVRLRTLKIPSDKILCVFSVLSDSSVHLETRVTSKERLFPVFKLRSYTVELVVCVSETIEGCNQMMDEYIDKIKKVTLM